MIDWGSVLKAVLFMTPFYGGYSWGLIHYDWPFRYFIFFSLALMLLFGIVQLCSIKRPDSELSEKEEYVINTATD